MEPLKKAGLLGDSPGEPAVVKLANGLELRVCRCSADHLEVGWSEGAHARTQQLTLAWGILTFGAAAYLLCPETGVRCRALFLRDGRFISRQAAGLAYNSQSLSPVERLIDRKDQLLDTLQGSAHRGPARGENRARVLEKLRSISAQLGAAGVDAADIAGSLEWELERLRAKKKRVRARPGQSPMKMRNALHAGRTQQPRLSSREIIQLVRQRLADAEAGNAWRRPEGRSALKQHPEFDIRALRPKRGFPVGHRLVWPLGGGRLEVFAHLDLRDPAHERLLLCGGDGLGSDFVQLVAIRRGRRAGDLFLACPASGERVSKLYYRGGGFASRQTQRLVHGRVS